MSKETLDFVPPLPPKNYKISSAFSYNFKLALTPDVAKVLGISRAGAYELAHSRDFPSMKVGGRIIIPKDKFLLWIEKQCGEG